MSSALDIPASSLRPSTTDLLECLRRPMEKVFGASILSLRRTPSRYSTSFGIENLELSFSDGSVVPVVFKNLSPTALLPEALQTRPDFVYDPAREIEVYRRLLRDTGLGTARLYAARVDPERDCYWLFLEKVDGVELYQVEELEIWKQAARWLRAFHDRFADAVSAGPPPPWLTRCDAGWYRKWMNRAIRFSHPRSRAALERLGSVHEAVVERLSTLEVTVLHGDFYASNVLTSRTESGLRVCPVDWERASVGPRLFDLGSLTTGWHAEAAAEIAQAYAGSSDADLRSLAFCRLQLCIQWLGWSPDWRPPPEHRQDWLSDALRLAAELGLT